jgi:hypothetical protein
VRSRAPTKKFWGVWFVIIQDVEGSAFQSGLYPPLYIHRGLSRCPHLPQDFFTDLDANHDGVISLEELEAYIARQLGEASEDTLAEGRGDALEHYRELEHEVEELRARAGLLQDVPSSLFADVIRERARRIFEAADHDGNGWLSHKEIKRLLHADTALRLELQGRLNVPWQVRRLMVLGGEETISLWHVIDGRASGCARGVSLAHSLITNPRHLISRPRLFSVLSQGLFRRFGRKS